MTCIVGYAHKGKVYIGGDSAGSSGYHVTLRSDKKVFTNKKFVIGFTSSFRMGQLLQYRFKSPKIKGRNIEEYMATDFVDSVRECFNTYGYGKMSNGVQEGGTFLVGIKGKIFNIQDDYQVGWNILPYDAVGAGYEIALGALHVLHSNDPECKITSPKEKVVMALQAASHWSTVVAPPFNIIEK